MSLGLPEIIVIVAILVLLFGGAAAAGIARQAGSALGSVKRVKDELTDEVNTVFSLDDPPRSRRRRPRPEPEDEWEDEEREEEAEQG